MLKKLGTAGGTKNDIYQSMGPVIKNKDDIRGYSIYFNPYYEDKDPMKEFFLDNVRINGGRGLITNPFKPKAEYGYDSNTYEKFQAAGFIQPEVDPWLQ